MEEQYIAITARCPIRTTLEMLGGKWKLLILFQLSGGPLRNSELKKQIPDISDKMLAKELHHLVDSDLVARISIDEAPHQTRYFLTDKGRLALPILEAMRTFALQYDPRPATCPVS